MSMLMNKNALMERCHQGDVWVLWCGLFERCDRCGALSNGGRNVSGFDERHYREALKNAMEIQSARKDIGTR